MVRKRNENGPLPPLTLRALLGTYEPTGVRMHRRRLSWLVGLVLAGWIVAPVCMKFLGPIPPLGGLLVWLTWEAIVISISCSWSRLVLRVLSGFGIAPYVVTFLVLQEIQPGRHPEAELAAALPASLLLAFADQFLLAPAFNTRFGDSPRDRLFESCMEALAWLSYWADGTWDMDARQGFADTLRLLGLKGLRKSGIQHIVDRRFTDKERDTQSPGNSAESVAKAFVSAAEHCDTPEPEVSLFSILIEATWNSTSLTDKQETYLRALGQSLGLDENFVQERIEIARQLARPMGRGRAAEILGVSPDASADEIETAFQRAAERADPNEVPILAQARAVLLGVGRRPPW